MTMAYGGISAGRAIVPAGGVDLAHLRRAAAVELLARNRARNHLLDFTTYTKPGYQVAHHHRLICDHLEMIERREIDRLLITMPPRHGKSELASRRFPAWYLGRHPDHEVIAATYQQGMALNFGRDVRGIFAEPSFARLFDARMDPRVTAADDWRTTEGGSYFGTSVSGAATGRGAHILLIDDPLKGRKEADSEKIREALWEWYQSVAYTRLAPGGAIVLIQTRWHEDDLAARVLANAEEAGESWVELSLPAIDESGAALWPERYPLTKLQRIRTIIREYNWASLYQQEPVPRSGGMFKRHWFPIVSDAPRGGQVVRRWDLAATEEANGNDPDWTVGVKMRRMPDGMFFIEDVERFRGSPLETESRIMRTARADGPGVTVWIPQDPGATGKMIARQFVVKLAGIAVCRIAHEGRLGGKTTRADGLAAQAEAGNVRLLRGEWNGAFLDEVGLFPSARHDDQVDAASGAYHALVGNNLKPIQEMQA